MKKILDLKVGEVTAERLCEWLSAELNSSNPGMREMPSGEYLSVYAECVPPERGNPYYHVVIRGRIKDLDNGKESNIDSVAWLVIRSLLETRHHVSGFVFVYADMLKGWFDGVKDRMRWVFEVEEVQEDDGSMLPKDYSLAQILSYDGNKVKLFEQELSSQEIAGYDKQQITNQDIEMTINTDAGRFETWLDRYRIQTTPFIVEIEKGKSLSVRSAPTYKGQYQGVRYHEIAAAISTPHPTEPNHEVHTFTFPVIEIELFEPAYNRLFVKAVCKHPALSPYFRDFLIKIAKLWPETKKSILSFLIKSGGSEEQKPQKVKTLLRDLNYPIEIIDAAIYTALRRLGYPISSLDENESSELFDELNKIFGLELINKRAIREEMTSALVIYHWADFELGIVSGALGGIELRKKQENLTEISIFPPPGFPAESDEWRAIRQKESIRRSKEVINLLEKAGYLRKELADRKKTSEAYVDERTSPKQVEKKIELKTKPAGRRVEPCNPAAWKMIVDGGESEEAWKAAFIYWCKEKEIDTANANKYDRDAFKKAMDRAKKRER